jgi:hypothetical protein
MKWMKQWWSVPFFNQLLFLDYAENNNDWTNSESKVNLDVAN